MKIIKIILLPILLTTLESIAFKSLNEAISFSKANPEYPDPDNESYDNPDYSSIHKKYAKKNVVLSNTNNSRYANILNDLKKISNERVNKNLTGRTALVLKVNPGTQFIVIANSQGEFHSLTRILKGLFDNKIIDQSFKILKDNIYLIFDGNMLTSSPYAFETLGLIINIMFANPNRVIFVKGMFEDRDYWNQSSLGKQISVIYPKQDVENLLRKFFKTLPIAVYVLSENSEELPIRISSYDSDSHEFDNVKCKLMKENKSKQAQQALCFLKDVSAPGEGKLTALIAGTISNIDFSTMTGLQFTDKNPPTWKIISSPSRYFRQKLGFHFDAFILLTIAKALDGSVITLINQDPHKPGFKLNNSYEITGGKRIDKLSKLKGEDLVSDLKKLQDWVWKNNVRVDNGNGIQKGIIKKDIKKPIQITKTIKAGFTCDLSKTIRDLCSNTRDGLMMAINQANKENNGKLFQITILDDKYTPAIARSNVEKFIRDGIRFVIAPVGTATLESYFDLIKEKKIYVLFPATGANMFHRSDLTNVINFRISNAMQAEILIKYIFEKHLPDKLAFFYQEDLYGKEALKSATDFVTRRKNEKHIAVSYAPNSLDVKDAVDAIKKMNPDSICLFSTLPATKELISKLGSEFLKDKNLFALSGLGGKAFKKFLGSLGLTATIMQITPNPKDIKLEIVKDYQKNLKEQNLVADAYSLEGYIVGTLFAYLISKIKGPVTYDSLNSVINGIKNYNFKGLNLNFNPQDRSLLHKIWIEKPDGNWIEREIGVGSSEKEQIILGSTMGLTKGVTDIAVNLKAGLSCAINEINQSGGINGKTIKIDILDDQYRPKQARDNIEYLLKRDVNIILSPNGSETTSSYLDLIEEGKIVLLFPMTGASNLRSANLKNVIHFGISNANQSSVLTQYVLDTYKLNKFAFVYQNDTYGRDLLESAIQVLKKNGIKEWVSIPYEPNTTNMRTAVDMIKKTDAEGLGFFSIAYATIELLKNINSEYLVSKKIYGPSSLNTEAFKKFLKSKGIQVTLAREVPDPKKSDLQIAKEYRNAISKYGLQPTNYSFLGYINGMLAGYILKKIQGPITLESVVAEFDKIKNYNFKGLNLNFNPMTRQLAHDLWIEKTDGSSQKVKVKEQLGKKSPAIKPIILGSTLSLTKSYNNLDASLKIGISSALNLINQMGGINGRLLKVDVLDDQYVPDLARKNIETFLKKNIDITISSFGSQNILAYLDLIKDGKVVALFPASGASAIRQSNLSNVINFRVSNEIQGQALIEYMIQQYKVNKFAFFYQNDVYGKDLLAGANNALKKNKILQSSEFSYESNTLLIKNAVAKIKETNPDAIALFSSAPAAIELINALGAEFLASKRIFGSNALANEKFEFFLKSKGLTATFAQVVPNPHTSDIEIVKEYRNEIKKLGAEPDNYSLEGYINTAITADIFKKIKSQITKEAVISEFEKIKNYKFKGLNLNFDTETRQLANYLWIQQENGIWIEKKIETKTNLVKIPEKVNLEETPVSLGCTMGLSRGLKTQAQTLRTGITAAINKINETGGIQGRLLKIDILDDEYMPESARKNIEMLLKRNIDIIVSPHGSENLLAYLDLVKNKKIAVLFPVSGASNFYKPNLKYLINFRTSNFIQGQMLTQHMIDHYKVRNFTFFYQADAHGKDLLAGAIEVLKKNNIEKWVEASYEPNTTEITAAAAKIKAASSGAIAFFSVIPATVKLIDKLGPDFFTGRKMYGTSTVGEETFKLFLKSKGLSATFAQVVPDPVKSDLEIVKEYRRIISKFGSPPALYSLEGFINAELTGHFLRKIKGQITKEALLKEIEKTKNVEFKGLQLNFNPETREIANYLWLESPEGIWTKKEIIRETRSDDPE